MKPEALHSHCPPDCHCAELLEVLKKAERYVGLVRCNDIPGDDPIFGVMDEIASVIAKAERE